MSGLKMTCFDCGQVNRVPADRIGAGPKCGTCGAQLVTGKVAELDAGTFGRAARTDDVPLVVDFWAPWCGPCRMMAPEFAKAAGNMKGVVRFAKVNTEEHQAVNAAQGIRGIPTMILFAGGRERARQSGAMPAPAIVDWVRRGQGAKA